MLCDALLKVRDCAVEGGGAETGKLVRESLAVLLACSSTAKRVALDGMYVKWKLKWAFHEL